MTETTTPKRKTPRWIKVLLTISLALNLLIVGAVAAKFFFPHPHHRYGKGPHSALARPGALYKAGRHLMWKLSRERRHEMFQVVRMHRANMKTELGNLAKARLGLAKAIASQPDNQAAFDKNWEIVKQAETAFRVKASALTADFIKNLKPDERKIYAEILQNPPRRRWFKRRSGFNRWKQDHD